ncbi:MAG: hypothetical protein AW07_02239 [Candidatus Accumulibacter sp. SK-11]|nr:MAG: hypothetical protein AW07_02239 [Candidatus Accumulibacter sp. SK-11]
MRRAPAGPHKAGAPSPEHRAPLAFTLLLKVPSSFCALIPRPKAHTSFGLNEIDGLMFIVLTSELSPRKRPIQPLSYSVASPKGPLTPRPTLI